MPWGGTWAALIFNMLLFVGVLAVLGLGAAWLVRQLRLRPLGEAGTDPLGIARRRLAAGQITVTQFGDIPSINHHPT